MARAARPGLGVPGLGAGRRPGAGAVPLANFAVVFRAPRARPPPARSRLRRPAVSSRPRPGAPSPGARPQAASAGVQARPPPAGAGGHFLFQPNFAARRLHDRPGGGSPSPARRVCGARRESADGDGDGDAPRPNSRPSPGRHPSPPRGWRSRGPGGGRGRAEPGPTSAPARARPRRALTRLGPAPPVRPASARALGLGPRRGLVYPFGCDTLVSGRVCPQTTADSGAAASFFPLGPFSLRTCLVRGICPAALGGGVRLYYRHYRAAR